MTSPAPGAAPTTPGTAPATFAATPGTAAAIPAATPTTPATTATTATAPAASAAVPGAPTAAARSAGEPLGLADYQALARFRRGLRSFLHFSEEAARAEGVAPSQHQLLLAIKGAQGPDQPAPAIGDVADWLVLRHHSAVELVDRAVASGLVARVADADDARCQRLHLTAQGEATLTRLSKLHREELRRLREETFAHLLSLR